MVQEAENGRLLATAWALLLIVALAVVKYVSGVLPGVVEAGFCRKTAALPCTGPCHAFACPAVPCCAVLYHVGWGLNCHRCTVTHLPEAVLCSCQHRHSVGVLSAGSFSSNDQSMTGWLNRKNENAVRVAFGV